MKVEVKKMYCNSQMPTKAHDADAGFDLYAHEKINTDNYVEYGTGIAVNIPEGYVGLIFPRSSISKRRISLANSVGVIDAGYQGEVKVRFYYNFLGKFYEKGDRIAQLVIMPIPEVGLMEVEQFSNTTERGEGGFGSTGK